MATHSNFVDEGLLELFQHTGVDLLVHNLSHSDIVLNIRRDVEKPESSSPSIFARPKFTDFRKITKDLYDSCLFSSQQASYDTDSPRGDESLSSNSLGFSSVIQSSSGVKSRTSSTSSASSLGDSTQKIPTGTIPVIFSEVSKSNSNSLQSPPNAEGVIGGSSSSLQESFSKTSSNSSSISRASSSSSSSGATFSSPVSKSSGRPHQYASGFEVNDHPLQVNLELLRFRRDDKKYFTNPATGEVSNTGYVDKMFFPHMSILLPNWLDRIRKDGRQGFTKVLILISGAGTPSDQKSKPMDNSTKYTGGLIAEFIHQCYSKYNIKIIHLHSKSNLFRYDDNISFVKNGLMAHIHEIRYKLAQRYASEWKKYMKVSLSFADGNSARVSAIQASMRYYKPDYFHFWQLKTFWAEEKLNMSDIEWHSFEEMSNDPAMDVSCLQALPEVQMVVDEMKRFKNEFIESIYNNGDDNDLANFWLRKTAKPVLSVLLVKKADGPYKLYRGTNMEVSMPTGSLCAERNVIGTALASDFTIKREHLKMVAVYSLPKLGSTINIDSTSSLPANQRMGGIEPSDTDSAGENVEVSTNTDLNLNSKRNNSIDLSSAPLQSSKRKVQRLHSFDQVNNSEFEVHTIHTPASGSNSRSNSIGGASSFSNMSKSESVVDNLGSLGGNQLSTLGGVGGGGGRGENEFNGHYPGKHMLCVETSETDMNPLKPCGACSEWLKKISEVNPQFSVVTFTDKYCQGVYIEEIAD